MPYTFQCLLLALAQSGQQMLKMYQNKYHLYKGSQRSIHICSLLRRCFLSSVADTTFIGFDYMSNAVGVLKKQQMLILNKNLGSLLVCCRGVCCSSFSGLCVVVIFVLFVSGLCILLHVACVSELSILGCPLVFTKTNCFGWRSLNYIHQVYHFSRDDVHIIYSVL